MQARHRVLAPNLRGRSSSIIPDTAADYALGAFRDNLRAVLEWIGRPAVLVAWSMGVSVTLEMMRTHGNCGVRGLALVEAAEPHAVAASWQHVKQADFRALLPEIRVPALVIHGTDDDQCPIAHGRLLAESIPAARLDEWPETGHNPMAKDGQRFAAAIREFITNLTAT